MSNYYFKKPKSHEIINFTIKKNSKFWEKEGDKNSIKLFKKVAKNVPAYKDFLKKNKINPEKIKKIEEFKQIPTINKKNYLRKYHIEDLCWDGILKEPLIFTSTSGSTGKPFYFPRWQNLDWEYSLLVEDFLQNSSYKTKGPILVIIGFGMGIWIGGLITYKAFEIASRRNNLPVSIITPGINKIEILKTLKNIAPNYKETIIVGYPPFLKDIIDEAKSEKINLHKLNIRLFSAAESYTEKFRDYIAKNSGIKNTFLDITNIYGTADIGAMAWETPTSILIRRLAVNNKKLFKNIFLQTEKTPTLAQYNPLFINFESVDNEIVLTGNNAIPLVRYEVGDQGGVRTFDEIRFELEKKNFDIKKESKKHKINHIHKLPFVYILERSDFSVSLYGLQIYPEPIRESLLSQPICNYLTGKFVLEIRFDSKQNQFLQIHLELKDKNTSSVLKGAVLNSIVENLKQRNSEYQELHKFLGKQALPKLTFWPNGDPKYFKPGIKQKWVKK